MKYRRLSNITMALHSQDDVKSAIHLVQNLYAGYPDAELLLKLSFLHSLDAETRKNVMDNCMEDDALAEIIACAKQ